ncbi:MAG: immunoglobulin-like domain-containing protein [Candidatus Paceibacterota bacterium]|jgi:hypothetical protein
MKKYLSISLVSALVLVGLMGAASSVKAIILPHDAGVGATGGGSGTAWVNPGYVVADDTNYATAILNLYGSSESLNATNYGFSIPAGATIDGIQVSIMRKSSSLLAGNSIIDKSVRLIKNGSVVGDNKKNSTHWATSMTAVGYGGYGDLWGATWTPADINASNFGVAFSVETESLLDRTASVDYVQMSVFYTADTTPPTVGTVTITPSILSGGILYIGNLSTISVPVEDNLGGAGINGASCRYSLDGGSSGWTMLSAYDGSNCVFNGVDTSLATGSIGVNVDDSVGNIGVSSWTAPIAIDNEAPVIMAHSDVTAVEATSGSGAMVNYIEPDATDNADATASAVCIPAPGSTFPLGVTTVTCNKTDTVGNSAISTTFNIEVVDTTAPVITLSGNDPFDMYINNDYATLNPSPDFSAIDAVDGDITGTAIETGQNFDSAILGSHTITYSSTDSHGNNTTITRTVNVVDRNKPIIYRIGGSPLTVQAGFTYTDAGATAMDRDGSDITSFIITVNPVDTNTLGSYIITYNVTGADLGSYTGTNVADQASRAVNVVDTTVPLSY